MAKAECSSTTLAGGSRSNTMGPSARSWRPWGEHGSGPDQWSNGDPPRLGAIAIEQAPTGCVGGARCFMGPRCRRDGSSTGPAVRPEGQCEWAAGSGLTPRILRVRIRRCVGLGRPPTQPRPVATGVPTTTIRERGRGVFFFFWVAQRRITRWGGFTSRRDGVRPEGREGRPRCSGSLLRGVAGPTPSYAEYSELLRVNRRTARLHHPSGRTVPDELPRRLGQAIWVD